MNMQTKNLDHLGLVAGICEQMQLVEQIDAFFPNPSRKVTVGEATKAMILNALGFVSKPMYLTVDFFRNKAIDALFRPTLQAEDFNDDTLGRALDALFEENPTTIFAQVASHALRTAGIEHRFFHLDTTSFSFHGEYKTSNEPNEDQPKVISLCHGFSKDNHPELKQAVVSLICSGQSSLPTWFEALDGNSSDKKSFPETIRLFTQQLQSADTPCFVMDSAFYTAENIASVGEVDWLTRVPDTLKQAKQLQTELEASRFQATNTPGYKLYETRQSYGGIEQRWFVIESEEARKREEKSFEKKLAACKSKEKKELEALKRQDFNCWEDAEMLLRKAEKTWMYHTAEHLEFQEVYQFAKRGKPKKGAQPDKVCWKIIGDLEEKKEEIEKGKSRLGRFVLATTMAESKLSGEEALKMYKVQGSTIERGFRFLKDPMFFAEAMYLKKPSRIMALLMVMTLSLLVYSLAEREVRKKLKESGESLPDQKGKPTQNITMRRIFQMFEGIHVLWYREEGVLKRMILNLTDLHHRILRCFGEEVQRCYAL